MQISISSDYVRDMGRITRRDVDGWLAEQRIGSIRNGPPGEIVAWLGLLEQHVGHLRRALHQQQE